MQKKVCLLTLPFFIFYFTALFSLAQMYFIVEGILDVYVNDDDPSPKSSLPTGAYFGEPAILSRKPVTRGMSIKARTFCQLESLSKQDFFAVSEIFPDILKILREVRTMTGDEDEDDDGSQTSFALRTTCSNTAIILDKLDEIMGRLAKLEASPPP